MRNLGNINLKGKKYKRLRCGCCEAIDFREDEEIKRMKKDTEQMFKTEIKNLDKEWIGTVTGVTYREPVFPSFPDPWYQPTDKYKLVPPWSGIIYKRGGNI